MLFFCHLFDHSSVCCSLLFLAQCLLLSFVCLYPSSLVFVIPSQFHSLVLPFSLPVHQQRAHDRTRTWRQEDLGSLDTSPPDPVRNERKKETSTFPDIRAGQRRVPAPACRVPVPVPAAKMHVIESQPGGWGERKPSPSFLSALQTQQDRIIRKVEAHR